MSSRMCSLAAGGSWYLGPLHPLSHAQLFVEVKGETELITAARLDWSRQQRLDEKLFEVRDLTQGLALANRSGWLTPSGLECAYAEAAEQILGMPVPARARCLRQVVNHMQQIAGLLLRLAALADLMDQPAEPWLRARENWLALLEQLTGARIHDTYLRIGGVASDLDTDLAAAVNAECTTALPQLELRALTGKARLSTAAVTEFNVIGVPTSDSDAAQRTAHLAKLLQTRRTELQQLLTELPAGAIATTLPKSLRLPVGHATATWPTATGDVSVWLHGSGGKSPVRVAVTNNSQRAAALFAKTAVGRSESDALLLLATLPIAPGELAL